MEINTLSPLKKGIIGVQYLFVAFGATVLVPLLVGLDPSTALFTAGIGTLIFHLCTNGKIPIFLGSSFAFIAPINSATELYGLPGTLSGMAGVAIVYFVVSALVRWKGIRFIEFLFPSIVIGPVIILIGLSLAGTAVNMAGENWLLAIISLSTAVVVTMLARGLMKLIPIFMGIVAGYLTAVIFFKVDLNMVASASWISLPNFTFPSFSWQPVLYMLPVAIAPIIEHIGNIYVVNTVAGKDFVKDPGLDRSLFGDGLACLVAGILGGPPVTTYAEVTGAMSITRITNPQVVRIAAVAAIIFSVIGKVSALLRSIPNAVLGGIMLLLFGTIASAGISSLIQSKTDLSCTRNIVIASLILTIGIGGAVLNIGAFSLSGIGLAALTGVILNLIIPKEKAASN